MSTFVDGLVEMDREQLYERAMAEAANLAKYETRVVTTMTEFNFDRDEAERFIEIEDLMAGVDRLGRMKEGRS